MTKLLLSTFVLLTVVALGLSYVNAEEFEQTVNFAVPDNSTKTLDKCSLESITDNKVKINCAWEFEANDIEQWYEQITNTPVPSEPVTICPDRFVLQEDGETCLPILTVTPDVIERDRKLIPFENTLGQYEIASPNTWSQADEQWKLEHLAKCWYGLYQGRGIQSEDWFVTSSWTETPLAPKATDASQIDRAMDMCRAQTTMLEILGDKREEGDVKSRQAWYGDIEPSHTEMAIVDPTKWLAVPTHANGLGERDFAEELEASKSEVCHSTLYSVQTKRLFVTVEECPNAYPTMGDVINEKRYIEYADEIEDEWLQYKEDGGFAQTKKIQQQKFEERLDRMRQLQDAASRQYAITSNLEIVDKISDTQKIKEIEARGWSLQIESERTPECLDYMSNGPYNKLEYLQRCGAK